MSNPRQEEMLIKQDIVGIFEQEVVQLFVKDQQFKKLDEPKQCTEVFKALQKAQEYIPEMKLPDNIANYKELLKALGQITEFANKKFLSEVGKINKKHSAKLFEQKEVAQRESDEREFLAFIKDVKHSILFRLFFITRALDDPFKFNPEHERNFEIIRVRLRGEFLLKIDTIVNTNKIFEENHRQALVLIVEKLQGVFNTLPNNNLEFNKQSVKQIVAHIFTVAEDKIISSIEKIDIINRKLIVLLSRKDVIADANKNRDYVILLATIRDGLNAGHEGDTVEMNNKYGNLMKALEIKNPKIKIKQQGVEIDQPDAEADQPAERNARSIELRVRH